MNGSSASGIWPDKLYCEYLDNPLGIDACQPRLTWTLAAQKRNQRQTAYQVRVASSREILDGDEPDLWDSGIVASNQTLHIVYDGKPLASRQSCHWKVRVWDGDGQVSDWSDPAFWSMGLLESEDWEAQWIAAPFEGEFPRAAHNGFHTEFTVNARAEKWVTIDLNMPRTFDAVRLHPACPYDETPGGSEYLFPVQYHIAASNHADFTASTIVVDEKADEASTSDGAPREHCFSSITARYLRVCVTELAERNPGEFGFALSQLEVLRDGVNIAHDMPVAASDSRRGTWSPEALTDGLMPDPGSPGKRQPAAMFRSDFRVSGDIKRATLYASALGVYEARINGVPVGDRILAPEWTDYHRRIQYQTYDVTNMVRTGDNTLGALLGDGWYAGRIGLAFFVHGGTAWGIYGVNPKFIAQLEIETADGRVQTLSTDASWRSTREGPIRENDILDGEHIDHRLEQPGWDAPGFDDAAWNPVESDEIRTPLTAQPNEPIRVIDECIPVGITEPTPGVYIFDMGQNMVGWVRFTASASAGVTVTLRHGEMLNPDGTLYTENLRSAAQTNCFTFQGDGIETFEPRFTYQGFRYVEVTGLPTRPTMDGIRGRVFCSSAPETAHFECSDSLLNQLARNILWTQRANLMSTPTDCPQRDERLGWLGDAQTFAQTAMFNMHLGAFFTKWLADVRDDQTDDGRFPVFAPHPYSPQKRFAGAPAWGDAGVIVPWRMYEHCADTRILEEHFDAARLWVDSVHRNNPDHIWRHGRYDDYNDWLNGDTLILDDYPTEGGSVPKEVFATAFYAHSSELLARMASIIGRDAEAERYGRLASDIRSAFWDAFGDDRGRIEGDTQAGYALALNLNLVPEALRPAAVEHLTAALDRYQGRLSTGFHCTHRLLLELTRNGHTDRAYTLVQARTRPSWGYAIDLGATTLWERWDGYVEGRGFQNPEMNSFNHWAFGSVGEWLYQVVGGIRPHPIGEACTAPGFGHIVIRPEPGGGLTHGETIYESLRGIIRSAWTYADGVFRLSVEIPPNTTATVYLPALSSKCVTESGAPLAEAVGLCVQKEEGGVIAIETPSGRYEFEASGSE